MTGTILEIAKLLLGAYFSYAKLNGATEAEVDELYKSGKAVFIQNTPDKLEDIG